MRAAHAVRSLSLAVACAVLGACVAPTDDAEAVVLSGQLEIELVEHTHDTHDTHDGGAAAYFLGTDDGRRVALVFGRITPPEDAISGSRIEVSGKALSENVLDVWSVDVVGISEQALSGPVGTRTLAVLLINFTDNRSEPFTTSEVRQRVFVNDDSPAAYVREVSFGQAGFTGIERSDGDVFGWFSVRRDGETCAYGDYGRQAREMAAARGVPIDSYEHVMHIYLPEPPCNRTARAGGRYSYIPTDTPPSERLMAHELGHCLGLGHAKSYRCTSGGNNVTLGESCTVAEYGDPFDVMGQSYGHFNAFGKARLGWLEPRVVSADAELLIAPIESASTGTQALQIARDSETFYYVEYRHPIGFDLESRLRSGVLIHMGPDPSVASNYPSSLLLDMTPETDSFSDAPLLDGMHFLTPDRRLLVRVLSSSSSGARVEVDFDPVIDTTRPTTPTGLEVTDATTNSISLAWNPSSDASGVSHYLVYRASGSSAFEQVGTAPGTTYTDEGLSYNTSYRYFVKAVDTWGNVSGWSSAISARTKTFCLFACI